MLPRVAARFCQGYLTGCLPDRADGVVARHSRDSPRDGSRMCSAVTRNDARSAHFRRFRQSRPCTSVTREKPEASAMRVRHKQSSTASAFIRFGQLPASEGHSCGPVTCVCGLHACADPAQTQRTHEGTPHYQAKTCLREA